MRSLFRRKIAVNWNIFLAREKYPLTTLIKSKNCFLLENTTVFTFLSSLSSSLQKVCERRTELFKLFKFRSWQTKQLAEVFHKYFWTMAGFEEFVFLTEFEIFCVTRSKVYSFLKVLKPKLSEKMFKKFITTNKQTSDKILCGGQSWNFRVLSTFNFHLHRNFSKFTSEKFETIWNFVR